MYIVGAVYDRTFFLYLRRKARGHRPRLQFSKCLCWL